MYNEYSHMPVWAALVVDGELPFAPIPVQHRDSYDAELTYKDGYKEQALVYTEHGKSATAHYLKRWAENDNIFHGGVVHVRLLGADGAAFHATWKESKS